MTITLLNSNILSRSIWETAIILQFDTFILFYRTKKKSACAEAIVLLFKNKKKKTFYAD